MRLSRIVSSPHTVTFGTDSKRSSVADSIFLYQWKFLRDMELYRKMVLIYGQGGAKLCY